MLTMGWMGCYIFEKKKNPLLFLGGENKMDRFIEMFIENKTIMINKTKLKTKLCSQTG